MNEPLQRLARDVARAQDELLADRSELGRARVALLAQVSRESQRSGRHWRAATARQRIFELLSSWFARPRMRFAVGAPAVFLLGLTLGWLSWQSGQPRAPLALSFRVGEQVVQESGRSLVAPAERPLILDFSDGSQIFLEAGGELRVTRLDTHGARLQLARGVVRLSIVHRDDTHWILDAGPFMTHVVGTRFEANWKPTSGNFELTMFDGAVELSGPVIGKRRVSRTERVSVSVRQGRAQIEEQGAPHPTVISAEVPQLQVEVTELARPPEGAASTPAGDPIPGHRESKAHHRRAPTVAQEDVTEGPLEPEQETLDTEGLARLSREGRYAEVVAAAVKANWSRTLSTASTDMLVLLGDAARLSGDATRAREAYGRVRARFPDSEDASKAAFALGRLEHDGRARPAEAARWFALYLREAPQGPLAREAMGRLMEAQLQSGAQIPARETAARYQQVYPDGPHSRLARRLLEER